VTGDQCQHRLPLPGTIAYIDVTELPGVVFLIVGNNVELLDRLFKELNEVIDRLRMDRTGRDVRYLMGVGNVQTDPHTTFHSLHRQLDSGAIAELRRRGQWQRDGERVEGGIRSQCVHHNLAFFL